MSVHDIQIYCCIRYSHCIIDDTLGNDRTALAVFRRYSFVPLRIDGENVEYFQGNKRAQYRDLLIEWSDGKSDALTTSTTPRHLHKVGLL